MTFSNCPLYGLQSKKGLKRLLHIEDSNFFNQNYVASLVSPYIAGAEKRRLIEPPHESLKVIQRRIKKLLGTIEVPDNVFSGIKGRSYADNAKKHAECSNRVFFKIDLSAFFPSISRETVYRFFAEALLCSPDIAEILTNLTTVDLEKTKHSNMAEIDQFLASKRVTCKNHLISGAPTSQIMSYLVNYRMFDELQSFADSQNVLMTVYVDDITFSSEHWISSFFKERVLAIVAKYGYKISKSKVKRYTKNSPKLVTGVVIDAYGNPTIKNSLRLNVINEFRHLQDHPDDIKSRQRLIGLISAARQVNSNAFPYILKFAKEL